MQLTFHKDELTVEDSPYESDKISNIYQSNGEPLHQDEEEELPDPEPCSDPQDEEEEEGLPAPDQQEGLQTHEFSLEDEAAAVLPYRDIYTCSEILDQKLLTQPWESPEYAKELLGIQPDESGKAI